MQCRISWFDSLGGKIPWRRDGLPTPVFLGFPCGSAGKESACNVGDLGSISGLGRSPGEGEGYPLRCSCLDNVMSYTESQRVRLRLSNFHFRFSLLSPSAWDCKFHEGRSLVCPVCCCPEQYTEGSLWLNGVEWASDQWVSGLFLSSNEGGVLRNWFHFVSVIRAPSTVSETPLIFDVLKLCWKTIISIENRQFQISEFSRILRTPAITLL